MNSYLIPCIVAYLLGSIPFGFIVSKIFAGVDVTKEGSGNIGATNVLRTVGKKAALVTWLLDSFKGVLALIIIKKLLGITDYNVILVSAIFSVLGHMFPIWLKFKGGKGVATGGALLLFLSPKVGILTILTWLLIFFISRISSLSAIVATSLAPVYAIMMGKQEYLPIFCFALSTLILVKHYKNIERLFKGQEKPFKK